MILLILEWRVGASNYNLRVRCGPLKRSVCMLGYAQREALLVIAFVYRIVQCPLRHNPARTLPVVVAVGTCVCEEMYTRWHSFDSVLARDFFFFMWNVM